MRRRRHARLTADERNEVRHPLRLCWRHVDGPLTGTVPPIRGPVEGPARHPRSRTPSCGHPVDASAPAASALRAAIASEWGSRNEPPLTSSRHVRRATGRDDGVARRVCEVIGSEAATGPDERSASFQLVDLLLEELDLLLQRPDLLLGRGPGSGCRNNRGHRLDEQLVVGEQERRELGAGQWLVGAGPAPVAPLGDAGVGQSVDPLDVGQTVGHVLPVPAPALAAVLVVLRRVLVGRVIARPALVVDDLASARVPCGSRAS